ncbi:ROK family protein [candidate division FCPU426 bacterium]|nr:ROK family protein [candidate division FCPU426 bacterium]
MAPVFLGMDLGGSNITAMLMTSAGRIVATEKTETRASQGPRRTIERIISTVRQVLLKARVGLTEVRAAGIGVPGVLDIGRGVVKYSPNLPGWKNIPLLGQIQKALKKPVAFDNDANVAVFGERWLGAGQGFDHVIMYTLGTGVGGGIIQDGRIMHGSRDGAGELGHTTIVPDGPRCSCGNRGCLEALVSGTAIAREGRKAARRHPRSLLTQWGPQSAMTAKVVFQAARAGDAAALAIVSQAGRYLGVGVANVINLLNPQIVIIGGGVSRAGEMLLRHVRAEAKKRALQDIYKNTKIVRACLADQAGAIGAAGIAIFGH